MRSSNITMSARRGIVLIGKYAPFIIVAIVTLSNIEALYSVAAERYTEFDGTLMYYKPISWWIGEHFELNNAWVAVLAVLSIGVEACIWNRACIAFLAIMLWQRSSFLEHTINETMFAVVLLFNSLVGVMLVHKGLKILFTKT